ncbi:MAG: TetR/AcrR family transcriptional regulator [Luteimonas sp.]
MRKNDPEGVRARILDAAAELFQERGYSASSMQHIFEKANVTCGAFYHHFESKKDLGLTVIKERVADAVMGTWIAPVRAASCVIDGIKQVFKAIAVELDANRAVRGCPLNNLTLEMAYADPDFQQLLNEIFANWQLELERLVKRDVKQGVLFGPSPKRTAAFIIAVYSGAMAMSKVRQSADPLRICLTELTTALETRQR